MAAAEAAAEKVLVVGFGPIPPLLGDRGAPGVDTWIHEPGRLLAPKGPSSVVSDVSDTRMEDSWVKPERAEGTEPPELIPGWEPTDQSGTADNLCKATLGPTMDPLGAGMVPLWNFLGIRLGRSSQRSEGRVVVGMGGSPTVNTFYLVPKCSHESK